MQVDPFAAIAWQKRWLARLRRWALTGSRPLRPAPPAKRRRRPTGPPNLLVLAVDTLRWDHLGLAGHRPAVTPEIDALAARGTVLADVTSASPWTLPSFASSLTGLPPWLHGAHLAGSPRSLGEQAPARLRPDAVTLAAHLRRLGWRTAAFYSNPFFAFGPAESFERHAYLNLPAGELAFLALDWVRRHADRPFFCFVLFNDPHEPTTPARRWLQPRLRDLAARGIRPGGRELRALMRWGEDVGGVPYLGAAVPPLGEAERRALAIKLALYDAAVAEVDASIGHCLRSLERWGLAESTLAAVFADHGEEFLDHAAEARRWDHDPRALRAIGHGHTLFQELIRVPALAAGPGVPAGARLEAPVSLCDLSPTLLEWMGLPPLPYPAGAPTGWCGRSVAGAAAGGPGQPASPGPCEDRVLVSEDLAYGPDLVAVRRGAWKLMAQRTGEPLALYDLASDPGETQDRLADRPEVGARLLADLAAWREAAAAAGPEGQGGAGGPGWQDVSDTVRKRLAELGYSD